MENELIYGLIPKIMDSIGAIGKSRKNPQQGYMFRGIDDLYNAVQSALIEHKVFLVPGVVEMRREERVTKAGGVALYTMLTMKYTFYAEDGSHFTAITVGEAMDTGDKSCNKAMSAAQKYALLQVFCIPTEESKDTEDETHELGTQPKAESGTKTTVSKVPNGADWAPPEKPEEKPPLDEKGTLSTYKGVIGAFKEVGALNKWFSTERKRIPPELLAEVAKLVNERLIAFKKGV